jgi:hypothetical protein
MHPLLFLFVCFSVASSILQGLIHWSGQDEAPATWKDLDEPKQRFPRAPSRGQAGSQRRENVSIDPTSTLPPEHEEEVGCDPLATQPTKISRMPSTKYASQEWLKT